MHFWACYLSYTCLNAGFSPSQTLSHYHGHYGMTAAASTTMCTHGRTSRSTRVQQAVVLLMYTKKYGRIRIPMLY